MKSKWVGALLLVASVLLLISIMSIIGPGDSCQHSSSLYLNECDARQAGTPIDKPEAVANR